MGADYFNGCGHPIIDEQELARLRIETHRLQALVDNTDSHLATLRATLANVTAQRDQYARAMDGLVAELAKAQDSRVTALASQALAHLSAVMTTLARDTGGPDEQCVRNEARAFLVEAGCAAPEMDAMRTAYEQWEARRAK